MASTRDRRHTETESVVDYVQVDGLVVLKIIKHCSEEAGGLLDVAQGVLLGLINSNFVEITNCFPIPPRHAEEEEADDLEYQMEMMRQMRHVNVDHLHVGWYQSSNFGSYSNRTLLESQFGYQTNITESVVLIYDPIRTTRGFLSLRAFRLSQPAMKLLASNEFSAEQFKTARCSFENMFEEIPVVIRNSHLVNILLCELTDSTPVDVGKQLLDMSTAFVLEKNLQAMMVCVDALNQETNKFINYQRQVRATVSSAAGQTASVAQSLPGDEQLIACLTVAGAKPCSCSSVAPGRFMDREERFILARHVMEAMMVDRA